MIKCTRCNGSILKDGEEYTCFNCGYTLPDKFTQDLVFNNKINKYEERYQKRLVTEALMRHPE